jgi:16S rRNA (guanine966-N2)-methyltransferase
MRITGGTLRGRQVLCPPGVIRPAMDRMRESLFSILGALPGYSFLDLFSGSGMMALEAHSRGASPVRAVERDKGKREVILKNFNLANDSISLSLMPVERFVVQWKQEFDIIYLDPPFDYRFKMDLLKKLAKSKLIHTETKVLIHFPMEDELEDKIESRLELSDKRIFGRSHVNFYSVI